MEHAVIRLVIIDDHQLFRQGLALVLAPEPDLAVVGDGASAVDAVRLAGALLPDILLLDLDIPGSGLAALREISALSIATRVIILTASASEANVVATLGAGARGYVLKGVSARRLVQIIRRVHAGESYMSPELAAHAVMQVEFGAEVG